MNKHILYSLTLAALSGSFESIQAQDFSVKKDNRPNIILFLVDDMGMAGYLFTVLERENLL